MMHSIHRLSGNDSNNNSIESNKENSSMVNNITTQPHHGVNDSRTKNSEMAVNTWKNNEDFSETRHNSPLVVHQLSRTPSPIDKMLKNASQRRPSSLMSPSSSIASHSPSPDRDTEIDIDSPVSRSSPITAIPSHLDLKPALVSKPGLSFGIDRILGNSSSCSRVSENLTEREDRVSNTTDSASERRSRTRLAHNGSVSDDSGDAPNTPRSAAPSPSEDEPNEDLIRNRLAKDTENDTEAEPAKGAQNGFSANRPGYPRPLEVGFRFPGAAAGNGHLTRPGYQDFVVNDMAGHAGHVTNGPHIPYHNSGMFLPPRPASEISRIEQHSTPSLSSLDLLPVRPILPDVFVCPWTGVQRDRFGLVRRIGHPYQNRTPPKRKKPRTAFTRQQVLELEKRFSRQKYLASAERSSLAKSLGMSDAQVKTWFQNRRTKWRRQTAEEREIERQAAHKFLLSLRPDDAPRPMTFPATPGVSMCPPVASQPGRLQPQPDAATVQDMGLS